MSALWKRRQTPPPDRREEIDTAVMANAAAMADAHRVRAHAARLAERVERITDALLHEGAENHFTERIETALRGTR